MCFHRFSCGPFGTLKHRCASWWYSSHPLLFFLKDAPIIHCMWYLIISILRSAKANNIRSIFRRLLSICSPLRKSGIGYYAFVCSWPASGRHHYPHWSPSSHARFSNPYIYQFVVVHATTNSVVEQNALKHRISESFSELSLNFELEPSQSYKQLSWTKWKMELSNES